MKRSAVIVDKDGVIKHTVVSMRMIYDMIEVSYVPSQSINNSCLSLSSVGVMDEGDCRVFLLDVNGRSVSMEQLKTPKTYDELDDIREAVRKFNE